jgi:hypothetical protein
VRAEIRVLVAFADEYRSYREVIAAALSLMRPCSEVATSDLDVLGEKLATFDPHLVICSRPRPASSNAVDAWIELSLDLSTPARIGIGGHCSQQYNPTVETLLAIFDEVKQLIRTGRRHRPQPPVVYSQLKSS